MSFIYPWRHTKYRLKYIVDTNHQFAAENDFLKYQLAGFFTVLAGIISVWHVTNHIRHMHYAPVQKRILAILWLVPIYGFTSWLSLVWPRFRQEMSVVRDCYEAYAVYTFFAFLCEVLKYKNMSVKRQKFDGAKSHLPNGDYHAEELESYVHDTQKELSSCKESEVYSTSNVQTQMHYSSKHDHLADVFSHLACLNGFSFFDSPFG